MELTPAYGRDYKSAKEVVAAFEANKDFIGDYSCGFQIINKPQIPIGTTVMLRFKGNRNVTVTKVKDHICHEPEPVKATKPPSIATMQRWMANGVAKATDGCEVEPDGVCQHGQPSWLLQQGII